MFIFFYILIIYFFIFYLYHLINIEFILNVKSYNVNLNKYIWINITYLNKYLYIFILVLSND